MLGVEWKSARDVRVMQVREGARGEREREKKTDKGTEENSEEGAGVCRGH